MHDGAARTPFERKKSMKAFMSILRNTLSVTAIIVCSLMALPLVAMLYMIPSVRGAFDQIAYEDAMKG